jgi:chromosome segregation ATPase
MDSEEERSQKLKEYEKEVKNLREADKKHCDVLAKAQAAACKAKEAERQAKADAEARLREAAVAERATREEAQALQQELAMLPATRSRNSNPESDDSAQGATAAVPGPDSTLLDVVKTMQQSFEQTLQAVVAQVQNGLTGGP